MPAYTRRSLSSWTPRGSASAYDHGTGPVTEYSPLMVHWMLNRRPYYAGGANTEVERPSASYVVDMLPPAPIINNAADAIPAKHLHSSLNKIKHPINVVRWTPEGRRLLTCSSSGEFTLWNGTAFNFETIMQAHDAAIRAASYSHSDDWLLSADQDGVVKYWQPNFNNVKVLQAHHDPIRDLAFSPNDAKFATASDDSTIKLFDFANGAEEAALTGHNWDVKSVDWHPSKGLLVSGSKDHLVKLWDPRTGRCLTTLRGHKNTISKTLFEPTRGQLLATCARDQTARVFDLRSMRDICLLRGHEKDIATLAWHPVHISLLSTGGADGTLFHYLLDEPHLPPGIAPSAAPYDTVDPLSSSSSSSPSMAAPQTIYPAHRLPFAHDFAIWSLDWHPLGHILASGSNDRVTRFWARPRPGEADCFADRYHIGEAAADAQGKLDRRALRRQQREQEEQEVEDEAAALVDQKMPARQQQQPHHLPQQPPAVVAKPGSSSALPGLPGLSGLPGLASLPGLTSTYFGETSPPKTENAYPQPSGSSSLPLRPPSPHPPPSLFPGNPATLPLPPPPPPPPSLPPLPHPLPATSAAFGFFQQFGVGAGNDGSLGASGGIGYGTSAPSSVTGSGGGGGGGSGGSGGGNSIRSRHPLPSQQETLAMLEQQKRRGIY